MRPGCALVGLDEQNAFGAVDWTDALRQTLRRAPAFAVALSMLWRGGAGILVFVLRADGTWSSFPTYGGVVKGNQEGSPVFCLVIDEVMRRVVADPRLAGVPALHWLYIDDWVVQLPLDQAVTLLDAVEESSAKSNLCLQRRKCAFHVPDLATVPVDEWPPAARALLERTRTNQMGFCCWGPRPVATGRCRSTSAPLPRRRRCAGSNVPYTSPKPCWKWCI